jgi:hypothetical protein
MPMDWGLARDYAARDVPAEELPVTEAESSPSTSRKAIASIVLGLGSFCIPAALLIPGAFFALLGLLPVIGWHAVQALAALAGTIVGSQSLTEIKRSDGRVHGRRLAWTGIGINVMATLVVTPAVLYGRVLPLVIEARAQKQSMINLRTIASAMHQYHDTYMRFPPSVVYGAEGKPLYSWRVLLLPFLGQNQLFERFKLDEPWDSSANLSVLRRMPAVFAPSGERFPPADFATHYVVFDSPEGVFYRGQRPNWLDDPNHEGWLVGRQVHPQRPGDTPVYDFSNVSTIASIMDGVSLTILLVEADNRVPWTKPEDVPYAADQPLPKLGSHYRGDFLVAMADGSVRIVSRKTSEKTIRAAVTARGGEILGPDWDAQ